MSDPHDVPPEFAETFQAAYRDAFGAAGQPPPAGHRRASAPVRRGGWWTLGWVRAVLAGAVALVLVLAAYGVGRVFSGAPGAGAGVTTAAPAGPQAGASVYQGRLRPLQVHHAAASCTAPPAVDGAGHRVTYGVRNALDGAPDTAWRCQGRAVGATLTFRLPHEVRVAAVGLVPGYAKTDPVTAVDRYAQDNRVTKVRWTIGDRSIVQRLSPDPSDRTLRLLRVPLTRADHVRLTILSTARGSLDITAISEVRIAVPR